MHGEVTGSHRGPQLIGFAVWTATRLACLLSTPPRRAALAAPRGQRPAASQAQGNGCVEVGYGPDGHVAVRDTKTPQQGRSHLHPRGVELLPRRGARWRVPARLTCDVLTCDASLGDCVLPGHHSFGRYRGTLPNQHGQISVTHLRT
ncbi:MAG: DUF397 domain-containing protein [Sciscionella sp.]